MKGMLKRALAGVAAAALAVTGLAVGASTANAADTPTLTITNAQEGHTYTAYLLGKFTNVGTVTENCVSSVDLDQNDEGWGADVIANAVSSAGVTVPQEYTGNELAYMTTSNVTAAQLRSFVTVMAGQESKPSGSTGLYDNGAYTINVTDEGWYLVVDSDGSALLVSTGISVDETTYYCLAGSTIGTAESKPNSGPSTDKTVSGSDTLVDFDGESVAVGDTVSYKVTVTVPNTTGYDGADVGDPYVLYIQDVASTGLTVNTNGIKVTLAGKELVLDTDYSISSITDSQTGVTTTLVTINDVAGYDGKSVVVTYTATVNGDVTDDAMTNTASASHDNTNWGTTGTTTVKTYKFSFTKLNMQNQPLEGAKFVVKVGGKYLADDEDGGWTVVDSEDGAHVFTTESDGVVTVKGVPAGDYTVVETEAPAGYMDLGLEFDVTVSAENGVVFKQDGYGLVDTTNKVVKNVTSISELPQTGAAGIALFVVLGLLIAGAGVTVWMKSRNMRNAAISG